MRFLLVALLCALSYAQTDTCHVETWDGYLYNGNHPRSLNPNAERGKTYKIVDYTNSRSPNYHTPGVSSAIIEGEGCLITFIDKHGVVACTLGSGTHRHTEFAAECGNDMVVEYGVNVIGECRWCDCVRWDGNNYSQCSPIPNQAAGTYHTVKCREDGVTPMPGLWTNHAAECAKYSGRPSVARQNESLRQANTALRKVLESLSN